ncbi:hypothetical protein G7Y89_g3038 [Cudoniella acicularis]|uniref:Uncharacterized protein n=1 Tax=Cudoniella acicularis TaxID=354080 RepID=A0A8H4W8S8_9HELO|nr:hypothetical protein G7Y89_g3038 [Cudoniella acicularis]
MDSTGKIPDGLGIFVVSQSRGDEKAETGRQSIWCDLDNYIMTNVAAARQIYDKKVRQDTAIYIPLTNQNKPVPSFKPGFDELCGCISVVIVSKTGFYAANFYEASMADSNADNTVKKLTGGGQGFGKQFPGVKISPENYTALNIDNSVFNADNIAKGEARTDADKLNTVSGRILFEFYSEGGKSQMRLCLPLMTTALNLDFSMMKLLLDRGADIEAPANRSGLALVCLAWYRNLEAVPFLLDHGANIKSCNNVSFNAVQEAAFHGYNEILVLLLDSGAHMTSCTNNGYSALSLAVWGGIDVLQLLLDRGADINAVNEDHATPLHD